MHTVMPVAARGPLAGAVIERLSSWLAKEKYARTVVPQVIAVARGLSAWLEDHDVDLNGLSTDVLGSFIAHYGAGIPGHALVTGRLPTLRRFLIESDHLIGATLPSKLARRPSGKPAPQFSVAANHELDVWATWQREVRGIGDGCVRHRRQWVSGFVDSLCSAGDIDWGACDVGALNSFIARRSAGYSPASRALIVDATRSLMRWALATGRVDRDLSGGIMRAQRTRATLPRGLTLGQVEELLAACNPTTMVGVRDRAVITMLWRLGVRAGEAASLTLDDIDWAVGRLTIVGKGQRRLTLPIPVDVGEALLVWLRARPAGSADRGVFSRVRAPLRGLSSAGISDIVKHRAELAGLGVVHAHQLRHAAAMNVIASGGTLVEAQELLGHQHTSSTKVYARTDLESLRALTVSFGQVP